MTIEDNENQGERGEQGVQGVQGVQGYQGIRGPKGKEGNGILHHAIRVRFILVYIAVIVSILALVIGVNSYRQNSEIKQQLVSSCETAGDPVKEALVGILAQQNAQTKNFDYSTILPDVDPKTLAELKKQAISNNNKVLAKLNSIPPCGDRFK